MSDKARTSETAAGDSPRATNNSRPLKRARVALACQRCKTRKQISVPHETRCNGQKPCSNCADFQVPCEYASPGHLKPAAQAQQSRLSDDRHDRRGPMTPTGSMDGSNGGRRQQGSYSHDEIRVASPRTPATMNQSAIRAPSTMVPPSSNVLDNKWPASALNRVEEVLRDLSLEASGGYIDVSSIDTMGRIINSMAHPITKGGSPESVSEQDNREPLSPKSAHDGPPTGGDESCELSQIPQAIADKLFVAYIRHVSRRWPLLPVSFAHRVHANRSLLSSAFSNAILHLIYAVGGRYLETTGETGPFHAEQHYEQALVHLDEVCAYHDIRTVQVLLLLAIYSLRSPRGPGAWTYGGLAIRQCIELGMHRKTHGKRELSSFDCELRKRVFWCCYCLDRQVSITLGRPFAISDRDIDAELPLDVDEHIDNCSEMDEAVAAVRRLDPGEPPRLATMTAFVYITELRKIESQIQQSIYRVDSPSTNATEAEVNGFVQQLDRWKDSMPVDMRGRGANLEPSFVDGHDYFMVYYYKSMRFLLHPVILSPDIGGLRWLRKCAEACGGVCQTYKKLHKTVPVGFSVMALHSVFLAGLTLLYCIWASPKDIFSIATSNAVNSCSIVLYIITERWKGVQKYRDVFETIKQLVLDSIEEGHFEPRKPIQSLKPGLESTLQVMDAAQEGRREFSAMMVDMAGGPGSPASAMNPPQPPEAEGSHQSGLLSSSFDFMFPVDSMTVDFQDAESFGDLDLNPMRGSAEHSWM